MKKVIISILFILTLFPIYYGYQRYSFNKTLESIYPAVKNTSLRVNNSLAFEINKTNISFNELFSKLESGITEIDKNILTIQSVVTADTKKEMDNIVEYLNASQGILRSQLFVYRKRLAVKVSLDISDRAMKTYKENASLMGELGLKHAKDALGDVEKEINELKNAEKELSERFFDLMDSKNKVAIFLPVNLLADQSILDEALKKYP